MDNDASAASPQASDNWPPQPLRRVLQGLGHHRYHGRRLVSRKEISYAAPGTDPGEWYAEDLLRQFARALRHVVQAKELVHPSEYGVSILDLDVYVLPPGELEAALRAAYAAGRDDAGPSGSSPPDHGGTWSASP